MKTPQELTDEVFNIITKNSSGKISDLIIAYKEAENVLKNSLSAAYNLGLKDGKQQVKNELINKQKKEN